jgi:mannosyltransferase
VKQDSRARGYRWILPILLLAFLLRIAYLDAQSLWWDEAFSATISSMDLKSLLESALADRVHPPLYYLILHFWLGLGQSEFVIRGLSAFMGVLAVASIFPMATRVGGRALAVISGFALAVSPFHIWFCQEARMYSLAATLVLMSCYSFVVLLDDARLRNWLAYGVLSLLAVYTHYLTLFVVLAQMTYLTATRRRHRALLGKWVLCAMVMALLYTPWLIAMFLTGGFYRASISWIRPAQPTDLFWTIYTLGLGSTTDSTSILNIVAGLLLVALLAYVSFRFVQRKTTALQRRTAGFVWLWLLLPLILVFLISLDWPLPQKRSIYMDRFFVPLLPAFVILISCAILELYRKRRRTGIATAIALLIPVSLSVYSMFSDQRYQRDQWRQAIEEIRARAESNDLLLVRPHDYVPLYYYDPGEIPWYTVPYLESRQEYEDFLNAEIPARLTAGGRLWTMIVSENADTHRFAQGAEERLIEKVENDPLRDWLLRNSRLLDQRFYNGLYLSLFADVQTIGPVQQKALRVKYY